MTYKAVGDRPSTMLHLFSVQTCATQITETSNIHRTRLWGLPLAVTRCQVSAQLHIEAKVLKVMEHSELLSAQYLARCLEPGNVCHSMTTRETPKRRMKGTLFTRHRNTVEPLMLVDNRKTTLQAIHTDAINKAVKYLTRKERATLAQLKSGYCKTPRLL